MEVGNIKYFIKSGNRVRLLEKSEHTGKSEQTEWLVERVDGASKGKQMLCRQGALVDSLTD